MKLNVKTVVTYIYIGETCRNGHTRGIEHVKNARSDNPKEREKSVMLRHRKEKHEGAEVNFEMNVIASYQHNALGRQCGEAVWIKEVDPNKRINNKEEYHQPGDVEIVYTKNDNKLKKKKRKKKRNLEQKSLKRTIVKLIKTKKLIKEKLLNSLLKILEKKVRRQSKKEMKMQKKFVF